MNIKTKIARFPREHVAWYVRHQHFHIYWPYEATDLIALLLFTPTPLAQLHARGTDVGGKMPHVVASARAGVAHLTQTERTKMAPPFPVMPMVAIAMCLLVNAYVLCSLFPYVGYMVRYLGTTEDKDEAGKFCAC